MTAVAAQQQAILLKPNRLYTKRMGLQDIKVVKLYEWYGPLIDPKYHDEMYPKPPLDVWCGYK